MTISERIDLAEMVWRLHVLPELISAWAKFPRPAAGPHEAFSVLDEERDELWDEIKANNPCRAADEAKQVAAMAVRFLVEVSSVNDHEARLRDYFVDQALEGVVARLGETQAALPLSDGAGI